MWKIILCLSVISLTTLTNGQQVTDPPRIVNFPTKDLLAPEDVKFSRQNALKLPCDAVGSNLQWTWKHNGTAITTGGKFTVGADGTLYGSYLESAQSGHYQCFVRDTVTGIETFSRKIQVAVTVVGRFSNQNEQEVLVDLGEEFSYDCPQHSSSYGVSYSWQGKINTVDTQFKRNDRRAISQTGQLLIMYVTQQDIDDFAEYDSQGIRCFMTGARRFESSGILKLKKKTAGQTDPGTPRAPAWRLIPANTETAVEGRNKTLYCLAVGRPVPTITWKKQNKSGNWQNLVHGKDSFENATAFQGRRLNIISVKEDMHETKYRCEAENSQSAGTPLVHDIQLNVEVAPKFTAEPPSQLEIVANGTGNLTCDVFADPSPSFKWYKNGKQLTTSTVQVILNGNKLVFKNVRYPDEIGIYQCVAENPHGMIVSSTYVKVLATKPSFAESGFGPFYLFRGTVGRLTCNPRAAPRPSKDQYKWYKGTTLLTSSPPYKIGHGEFSTLIIENVNKTRDEGIYKCYAENFLGNNEATATATVLERTIIVVQPRDQSVDKGTRVDLRCEATADPSLELRYYWKKDNAVITYNNKTQWLEGAKVLTIANITVDEAGNYTCVAYTSGPIRSEDQASATIDVSAAPPYPPTNLAITNCFNRTTTLSWVNGAAKDASITKFIIEQESSYEPNVFYSIENVTNPNATSFTFNLTGWATLRFRLRAVNRFGPSRPSVATSKFCRTDVGPPDKYPDRFRGNAKGTEKLDIVWTAMPKVDWNAPGLFYLLKYRELPDGEFGTPEKITVPAVDVFAIPNPGIYKLWEFQIQAGNDVDLGPESPVVRSYSGQDRPKGKPGNVQTGTVTARTVDLTWVPVTVTRGSVDGYKIYYWGESRLSERRRREIPGDAMFVNVPQGSKQSHTVTKLTPYTNYNFSITAYNNGGEGPASDEAFATTDEAEPGPPSQVNVYAFAKYTMVTWKAPVEPNGGITKFRVGSAQYEGSQPSDDHQVSWQEVGPGVFRKLLDNLTPERNYVVEIQAQTSKGWGDKVRKTTRTVAYAPPAKPERPTAEGIAVDKVRVTYKFGLGGGYTHEFLVMYRRKWEGEAFQNTSWVNHFETQSIEIGGLNNQLYEFKTVGRNDYPDKNNVNSRSESPASDVTEGRPLPSTTMTREPLTSKSDLTGGSPIAKNDTAKIAWIMLGVFVALSAVVVGTVIYRNRATRNKRESDITELMLLEVPPERVTTMELLGRGGFGRVYKSVMRRLPEKMTSSKPKYHSLDSHEGRIVATKVLPENATEEDKRQLVREIELMKEVGTHRNIVSMLGYWIQSPPMMLIMEYVPNGDLLQWLRNKRQQLTMRKSRQSDVVERRKPPVPERPKLVSRNLQTKDVLDENLKEENRERNNEESGKDGGYQSSGTKEIKIDPDDGERGILINDAPRSEMEPLCSSLEDEDDKEEEESDDINTSLLQNEGRKGPVTSVMVLPSISIAHFSKEKELTPAEPLRNVEEKITMEKEEGSCEGKEDDEEDISGKEVLCYAWQIAKGMEYLASKGFIHRDLAARNILLGEDKAVKIADFGLLRRANESEIYEVTSVQKLPMKWMAPEALGSGIFTFKTDVWSFGVVLWELATMGGTPYPGITPMRLCSLLNSGYRMEKPNPCSDEIYKLMMDCWKEDPNERPSFIQLMPILEEMMTEDTPYYYFRLLDQNQPCYREASATNTSKTSTLDTKL